MNNNLRYFAVTVLAVSLLAPIGISRSTEAAELKPPPLPIEPTGIIGTLPERYPDTWFLVQDAAFFHMSDGKVIVLDVAEDTVAKQFKGTFNVSFIGSIVESLSRGEIYAIETFHSRGSRGKRTDVVTIWDKKTLSPSAEIVWPTPKRYTAMPTRWAFRLVDDERLLLAQNFTPATSVTVIDTESRKIVNEVATPGCTFIYPTGKRGFSSLCADGRFMSTELAKDGSLLKQTRTDAFFDSSTSPIFERPALIGNTAYFPAFDSLVYPVDLSGEVANVGDSWSLVTEQERKENWRPGGIGIVDVDSLGRFYVLMHPDGRDGTQNGGGSEVWVFDPTQKRRVLRIPLKEWGLTIAVSRSSKPLLLVTNPTAMSLEVYDALSGDFVRSVTGFGQETPLLLQATK